MFSKSVLRAPVTSLRFCAATLKARGLEFILLQCEKLKPEQIYRPRFHPFPSIKSASSPSKSCAGSYEISSNTRIHTSSQQARKPRVSHLALLAPSDGAQAPSPYRPGPHSAAPVWPRCRKHSWCAGSSPAPAPQPPGRPGSGLPSCIFGPSNAPNSIAAHARSYWATDPFNARRATSAAWQSFLSSEKISFWHVQVSCRLSQLTRASGRANSLKPRTDRARAARPGWVCLGTA